MHNAYVGQIHNINGMIDYYYEDCLPHLLQEFDDVYHDVADVVLDSLSEGSKMITEKVGFFEIKGVPKMSTLMH